MFRFHFLTLLIHFIISVWSFFFFFYRRDNTPFYCIHTRFYNDTTQIYRSIVRSCVPWRSVVISTVGPPVIMVCRPKYDRTTTATVPQQQRSSAGVRRWSRRRRRRPWPSAPSGRVCRRRLSYWPFYARLSRVSYKSHLYLLRPCFCTRLFLEHFSLSFYHTYT